MYVAEHTPQQTKRVVSSLQDLGMTLGKDLYYYVDEGASHNELYWYTSQEDGVMDDALTLTEQGLAISRTNGRPLSCARPANHAELRAICMRSLSSWLCGDLFPLSIIPINST